VKDWKIDEAEGYMRPGIRGMDPRMKGIGLRVQVKECAEKSEKLILAHPRKSPAEEILLIDRA